MSEIKICLNCIVKNEEKIIKRMLYSLKNFIDYYVILDTGSTDRTIDLIKEFTEETNIKGEVHKSTFINFEQSRNEALTLCQNSNEPFDYILLCDADMNLVITQFFKKEILNKDVYLINQINGNLSYNNVRLIKKNLKSIKYKCPTHEYLDTANYERNYLSKELIYFDDKSDGGCKENKHTRDIQIFEDALKENPQHPEIKRIYFYLAQAYHCLRYFDEAIKAYEKKTMIGGWKEEIFISWYRIGNIYYEEYENQKKDYDKAIRAYLKAISTNNQRPEPLYKLIKMTRECGDITLSTMFARMYERRTKSDDFLFIENDIWDNLIRYEIGILNGRCFNLLYDKNLYKYKNYTDAVGFETIKKVEKFNSQSENIFINLKNNLYYDFENQGDFKSFFNPSITNINNDIYISVRNTNYTLKIINNRLCYTVSKDGREYNIDYNTPLLNRTIIFKNSSLFRVCNFRLPKYKDYCISGVEDIRLINFKNKLFALGNTLEVEGHKNRMVLIEVADNVCNLSSERNCCDNNDKYYLLNYEINKVQKNWSPFVMDNELYFVYSFSPLIILKFDETEDGNIKEFFKSENDVYDYSILKGGSQGICETNGDNNFRFITHFSFNYNGRTYLHQFVNLKVKKSDKLYFYLSLENEPFYIEKKGIEYVSGLCRDKYNNLLITYGVDDKECKLMIVK